MPYTITKDTKQCPDGKPFAVVNQHTGIVVPGGCHATADDAGKHLGALKANVPEAK